MGISKGCVSGNHDRCPVQLTRLKVNVLINNDGRACLTGFDLLAITSDQSTITPSGMTGDTIRRLSPERLHPEDFSPAGSQPTRESDCYALGMVIYEVLSGRAPFSSYTDAIFVIKRILAGERPTRPEGGEGAWFTDVLWETLELCWKPRPGDRPGLNNVLRRLRDVAPPSRRPSTRSVATARYSTMGPHTYPPVATSPTDLPNGGEFLAPPQRRDSESWVDRFARNAWKIIFNATTWMCCAG